MRRRRVRARWRALRAAVDRMYAPRSYRAGALSAQQTPTAQPATTQLVPMDRDA